MMKEPYRRFVRFFLGLTALWAIEGPPFRGAEHALQQQVKLFCEGLEVKRR